MTIYTHSNTFLEGSSEDTTVIANNLGGLEEDTLKFAGTDCLLKPNRDDDNQANQTFIDHFNGESSRFDFKLKPFLAVPTFSSRALEYFEVQQKWEGYVIEVHQDVFLARLIPIIGEGSDLEAEIFIQEVDIDDQVLIEPGAVFYWSIGYLKKPSGTIRASLIRFRRLPPLTQRELKVAQAKAAELVSLFDDKQSIHTTRQE